MNLETKVQDYLRMRFGPETKLKGMTRLGKGIHGVAYLLEFRWRSQERRLIMKTLFPSGFGHDHFSDRAQVLLLAHANYNELPGHVQAFDVVAESPEGLTSLQDATEFYIFMEKASGRDYFSDLDAILKRGRALRKDRDRVEALAHLLANLHGLRYDGIESKTLYRRRIRDLVGHGECVMGIIDAYNSFPFTTDRELIDYAAKCVSWWGKIRNRSERLCQVHGDYHPGNIWFRADDIVLLDRSRGTWGEAADDVSCLGINYIYYALKDQGDFKGPFADLFRFFLDCYQEQAKDAHLMEVIQPFFAFRALVLANPEFYPGDPNEVKRALITFGDSVLGTDEFHTDHISEYMRGS